MQWGPPEGTSAPTQLPAAPPNTHTRSTLTRHDGGRKLLTLETLHMPSRHCWAWIVTVLRAPPRPAGATDTWTLGPEDQASPFLLSGPVRPDGLPGGPTGPDTSLEPVMVPGPGPPWRVLRSSQLAGACSSRSASRVSWFKWVAHTSQRRSASGWHAGRALGTGSLSRSRAERQGSWGSKDKGGQSTARTRSRPFPSQHRASSQRGLCRIYNR